MLLNAHAQLTHLIFGFGLALFLALVCLLRMQYRRQIIAQARLDRGLRGYVATQMEKVA